MDADLIIIGGGSAGVAAALRARDLGAQVVLIERELLGGMCLHRGCVPTATAVEIGNRRLAQAEGASWGLPATAGPADFDQIRGRREEIIRQLHSGTHYYLHQVGVTLIEGTGRPLGSGVVEVEERSGQRDRISAQAILLAPGSGFVLPSLPGIDLPAVWTTDHCLNAEAAPTDLLVYGGNFIGVEWGQFFQTLGSRVTLVEPGPQLLPGEDTEIAEALQFLLTESGIEVRLNWPVTRLEAEDHGRATVIGPTGQLIADRFLVSDCRQPLIAGLRLAELRIATRDRAILTDDRQATTAAGIFAAGDVAGGRMLSHFARAQGIVAVEAALGLGSRFEPTGCPRAYHTRPEVAAVGLTEAEARTAGFDPVVGRSELGYNARALTLGQGLGLVKVIAGRRYGKLLGVHLIGPLATEVVAQATLALRLEALAEDLAGIVHGHPTLAEAVTEAAQDAVRQLN